MKKSILLFPFSFSIFIMCAAQPVNTPDKIYGRLFTDVQMNRIFPDNKTFADCIPKYDPQKIVADYLSIVKNPAIKFSLKQFVEENFIVPQSPTSNFHTDTSEDVKTHINRLWDILKRNADTPVNGSSLLPLPMHTLFRVVGFAKSIIGILILPCLVCRKAIAMI